MRALLVLLLVGTASADPLPPGALQGSFGMESGTGADSHRVGYGYAIGVAASWQPMSTLKRLGWSVRWSTLFGESLANADAARIDTFHTVLMDLTVGMRFRPWDDPSRYLTVRGGAQLFRSNQQLEQTPPRDRRDFAGGIATVGLEQYVKSLFLFSVDVRYGMFGGDGPEQLALVFSAGVVGP
jgi:hypothetical protein